LFYVKYYRYYETREAQKPLASIPLDNFYIRISKELYPENCCFELVSYNFIYQFIAASHSEMERWMDGTFNVYTNCLNVKQLFIIRSNITCVALKRKSQAEAENNLLGKAEEQIIEAEKQRSSFVQTYGENTHLRLRYYQQLLKPGSSPTSSPPPSQNPNIINKSSPSQLAARNASSAHALMNNKNVQ